jgi:hypothetical protein
MSCRDRFYNLLKKENLLIEDIDSIRNNSDKLLSEINASFSADGEKHGLLFGQVQSGKTNNIIMSIANAIDNGFKLFIVLTSDNTWLYGQTLSRIQSGLRSIAVFGKDDWRNTDISERIKASYESKAVVFVSTKNRAILESLTSFVCGAISHNDIAIIFDDEADQASLDTNQNKDDLTSSAINKSMQQLRSFFEKHVFIQVTATPQALFLQSASTGFRPDFVLPFHPGKDYIGGEFFFGDLTPKSPMRLIPAMEPEAIINSDSSPEGIAIPTGLRQAICFFFISASVKCINGDDSPFSCLLHISHRQGIHQVLQRIVNSFIVQMISGLTTKSEISNIVIQFLREAYNDLGASIDDIPNFEEIVSFIKNDINSTNVQILNSENTDLPSVSSTFNILIGGNRLGRGVTIGRLLVTYYGRSSKSPQIDTVLQHARMYGYRRKDAPHIRFYTTQNLFETFSNIYESDTQLRNMVFENDAAKLHAILLNRSQNTNLKPTRNNVLPLDQISLYLPGKRYFPYSPISSNVEILNALLMQYANNKKLNPVTIDSLIEIITLIKSEKLSGESWDDEAIKVCLKNLKTTHNNTGSLYVRLDRDIKQGARAMLSEDDSKIFNSKYPSLTMYRYIGSKDKGWDGTPIWVPNLRFPDGDQFYMYTPT